MNLIYKNTNHGYDIEIIGLSDSEKDNILKHFREMQDKNAQIMETEDAQCKYRSPNLGLCQIDGNFRICSLLCRNEECPKKERRKYHEQ